MTHFGGNLISVFLYVSRRWTMGCRSVSECMSLCLVTIRSDGHFYDVRLVYVNIFLRLLVILWTLACVGGVWQSGWFFFCISDPSQSQVTFSLSINMSIEQQQKHYKVHVLTVVIFYLDLCITNTHTLTLQIFEHPNWIYSISNISESCAAAVAASAFIAVHMHYITHNFG